MLQCEFCLQELTNAYEACSSCGLSAQGNHNFESNQTQRRSKSFAHKLWSETKRQFRIQLPLTLLVFVLLGALIAWKSFEEPVVVQTIDHEKACALWDAGGIFALQQESLAYGMAGWREAARQAAAYASGELQFHLLSFANGESNAEMDTRIYELCGY